MRQTETASGRYLVPTSQALAPLFMAGGYRYKQGPTLKQRQNNNKGVNKMFTIQLTEEQMAQLTVKEATIDYSKNPIIDSPLITYEQVKHIGKLKREHFYMLTLDGANRLINKHVISTGTLTASLVHPREVFVKAIEDRAASIIIAHNHPSGNLQPSQADSDVTERLKEAGELLGIALLDHLIVTADSYSSIIK